MASRNYVWRAINTLGSGARANARRTFSTAPLQVIPQRASMFIPLVAAGAVGAAALLYWKDETRESVLGSVSHCDIRNDVQLEPLIKYLEQKDAQIKKGIPRDLDAEDKVKYYIKLAGKKEHAAGKKVVEHLQSVADKGNAEAQFWLGVSFTNQGELEKAFKYLEMAAKQGDRRAHSELGLLYLEGKGVAKNVDKGIDHLQQAAEKGYHQAQFNLGKIWREGTHRTADYGKALRFFKLAAEQKLAIAQYYLGMALLTGEGGPANFEQAEQYLLLAAAQGVELAQDTLDAIHVYKKVNKEKKGINKALDHISERVHTLYAYSEDKLDEILHGKK